MASLSPTCASHTMRRATSPAICTATTSAPLGMRIRTLVRSLSSLASGRSADPNRPGRCCTAITSPLTGARCTWASNIDRKMLTRGNGVSPMLSSAGGAAESIAQITPSAGATMAAGLVGGTRCGCRKKPAQAAAASRPVPRNHR